MFPVFVFFVVLFFSCSTNGQLFGTSPFRRGNGYPQLPVPFRIPYPNVNLYPEYSNQAQPSVQLLGPGNAYATRPQRAQTPQSQGFDNFIQSFVPQDIQYRGLSALPQTFVPSPPIPYCRQKPQMKVDYGECPQLEPKEEDKKKKEEKMKECFKDLELNENSTLEALETNVQEKVNECVLRKQELLNDAGKFNFDKAEEKIKMKGLPEDKQKKVLESHVECKHIAERRFFESGRVLSQATLYEQCMDFHITMICNVKEYEANKTPYYHLQPFNNPDNSFKILNQIY